MSILPEHSNARWNVLNVVVFSQKKLKATESATPESGNPIPSGTDGDHEDLVQKLQEQLAEEKRQRVLANQVAEKALQVRRRTHTPAAPSPSS